MYASGLMLFTVASAAAALSTNAGALVTARAVQGAGAAIVRAGSPTETRIGAVQLAEPVPPMFYLRDPDGNTLLLVQPG